MEKQSVMLIVDAPTIVDEVFIHHEVVLSLLLYQVELVESWHLWMRDEIFLLRYAIPFIS